MLTSLAAVFHRPGEPLTLQRFPIPSLRGSEVLVRMTCATICGSDLHTCFGRRESPAPSVLGHEMVGVIAALGPQGASDFRGRQLEIGERVTWSMVWSCGSCFFCQKGLRAKCERLRKFGHERIREGHALLGGMAEYCHLPEGTAVFRVPQGVSDTAACPANCATATVAAILRCARLHSGESVVVLGAGMLGLTACAMLTELGAKAMVVEPNPRRRGKALEFGATAEPKESLPRGADAVLELSGDTRAAELGLDLLRIGGRLILAGAVFPGPPIQLAAEQVVRRMIRIEGVHNYSPEDLEQALEFLHSVRGKYPFQDLVEKSFPLSEVNTALEYAERERPFRVALTF